MPMDPEALYIQLGRLVETMPDLSAHPAPPDTLQWLGRACALVNEVGDLADTAQLNLATNNLNNYNVQIIRTVVYRSLAKAELRAPLDMQGAFIPVGNAFDAFAAIGKILASAAGDILIVDPYMDEKALTDFALLAGEGVPIRLLADERNHKATLAPAAGRWRFQYADARPLEVRLAPARTLHDRLIVVDARDAWTLTQSLNAFAARSPASIVRADAEVAELKIAAYQNMWAAGTPL